MHTTAAADLETRRRRSALTNDPRKLPGIDKRSREGRRFKDIASALINEFGDGDGTRLRELASLKYSLEQVQAAVVAGDGRACEDLVRLSNLITRREAELRARIRPRDTTPSVADIAARHRNGGAGA